MRLFIHIFHRYFKSLNYDTYSFGNLSAGEGIINISKWLSAGARAAFRPDQG